VVIEQLGPTGETTHTRTVDPQPLVEVTALANLGTKTHEGAVVDLPPGIYRVYPEESSETPVVVAVGEPAALANTIETDLRDDADRLTARADRVQALASAGDVTDLSAETNATGVYSMDVPSSVEALHLQAFGVDDATHRPSSTRTPRTRRSRPSVTPTATATTGRSRCRLSPSVQRRRTNRRI